PDEQYERGSDSDLRRRVLETLQYSREAHRTLNAGDRQADQQHDEREAAKQDRAGGSARRMLSGKEERQQDDRAELGERRSSDHELAEAAADAAGILERWDDHAQRRGGEDDRSEERRFDEPAGPQPETEDDGDRKRHGEAGRRNAQEPPTQSLDVELQPREEQQERKPEQGEDRDGEIGLDPPQSRGADHGAEQDLEHDRRKPDPREEPKRQGREEPDRDDDQEIREVNSGHGLPTRAQRFRA